MSSNSSKETVQNAEKFSHLQQTPLLSEHLKLGARVVDFGGWALPVNYGSQVDEHHAVRKDAGMFDVSHMTVSDVTGKDTILFLRFLLANDIDKAAEKGKALYSCMLNVEAGVIDDLIVYRMNDEHCRLVTNASTNEKDMQWIKQQSANFNVNFEERSQLALIAVQGPNAIEKSGQIFPDHKALISSLNRFQGGFDGDQQLETSIFIGRTGYTGEDGLEFIIPAEKVEFYWQQMIKAGIQPCGLGARDTLRLEAGMALYGNDLDENHNPLESGLKWTVSINDDRDFIGKDSLIENEAQHKMIGLLLEDRGVLRSHQAVVSNEEPIGEITSGTFSPTLEKSIALARVDSSFSIKIDDYIHVAVRNKLLKCRVVKYPFL